MGIQIASLFASIGADTSGLNKGLGSAKQSLSKFGGEIAKQVIGVATLSAAIIKAGQVVVESVRDWADYADSMRLSAQMAGVTTEEMSRLVQAADDFRVPVETMQKAMELALKNGFVPTIDNIAALSNGLLGITDPAERAAAASKIFGKSYADIMPFLLAGGNAIEDATNNIADNLVVTEKAAKEAKLYKDELDNLGDAWTGLTNSIGKLLVPLATDIFTGLAQDINNIMGDVSAFGILIANLFSQPLSMDSLTQFNQGLVELISGTGYLIVPLAGVAEGLEDTGAGAASATSNLGALTPAEQAAAEAAIAAAEAQAKFNAELADVTSLDTNYQGVIDLAYQFTDMLEQKEKLQIERQKLLSQGWSEQSTKVKELTENIAGLDADMKKMADQVTLDMFQATIAIGGVTKAELQAYMKMAIDMGLMSEDGAKLAMEAYGGAIEYIDGLNIAEKTGNVNIDATAAFFTLDLLQQYAILDKEARVFVKTYYGTSGGNEDPYENYTGPEYRPQGGGASGGYFMADTPYIVGERGPELFVPNANGQVIPNSELGGNNAELLGALSRLPTAREIATAVRDALILAGA